MAITANNPLKNTILSIIPTINIKENPINLDEHVKIELNITCSTSYCSMLHSFIKSPFCVLYIASKIHNPVVQAKL